jgi:hypothetical protein
VKNSEALAKSYQTPTSMIEAIRLGLCTANGSGVDKHFNLYINDYLAQKFQIAILRNPAQQEMLSSLFREITGAGK